MRHSHDSPTLNVPLVLMIACIAFASVNPFDRNEVHGQMVSTETCGSGCRSAHSAASIGPVDPTPSSLAGSDLSSSESTPPNETRWSSFLPLMADQAKKRGIELPLPFGVSTVFTGLVDRKVDITDVRTGVNGATPQSVSQYVNFGSTSSVVNINLKFDAWVLPFLNVYLLAGYVHNETTTRATITIPRPGPLPGNFVFGTNLTTSLDGFVGGGGMTLAGGYKNVFLVGDVNYSQTDIGFSDRFKALIATVRAGYRTSVAEHPVQLWVGEGYWNTRNTAKGQTDVPGLGHIEFEADQGPTYPWMTDFGTNIAFAKWFETVIDFGTDWHGGYLVVVAPTFRF